jgi:hypothetical protein
MRIDISCIRDHYPFDAFAFMPAAFDIHVIAIPNVFHASIGILPIIFIFFSAFYPPVSSVFILDRFRIDRVGDVIANCLLQ